MLHELVPMLPQALTTGEAAACAGIALAGTVLWLMGAVWARHIATLVAVAVGSMGGMLLPRYFNIPINPMALSVLGAIVCGVSAWLLHRLWLGLIFGVVMSGWVALATWMVLRGDVAWVWRHDWDVSHMTREEHARDVWNRLPEPVRRVMPYSAATAMITALSIVLLWPRLGKTLALSATGVTLLLLSMLTLIADRQPKWIDVIPRQPVIQASVLVGMVLLGALIQWQLLPSPREIEALKEQAEDPTRRYE